MKGQFNIEYLVAFGIFVTLIGYVHLSLTHILPEYILEVRKETTRSDAYLLSEVLINDPGSPADWSDPSTAKRIGLSDDTQNRTNLLLKSKINNFCSDGYDVVKERIGTDRDFSILILDKDTGTVFSSCSPAIVPTTAINTIVKRIATYRDGSNYGYVEVIVQMW